MKREREGINQTSSQNEMNINDRAVNNTSTENAENKNNIENLKSENKSENDNIKNNFANSTDSRLLLTNKTNPQTETEDRLQTEEDLSRYNNILKGYPKAKTYIGQISLIYPISKKTIEKMINARMTIECHFKDTYEQNITYGINQCFRFNKSRPSPAQVIAMITGDTVAELKQKELNQNKETESEIERIKEAREKYDSLRQEAFNTYRASPLRKEIYKQQSMESIEILDELMKDFLSIQAHILSFHKAGLTGYGIGLTNHLSKISTRQDKSLGKRWQYCFTMYLRSKSFIERVIRNNSIGTEVPTAFIEYIEELEIERRKRCEIEVAGYGRHQTKQAASVDIREDGDINNKSTENQNNEETNRPSRKVGGAEEGNERKAGGAEEGNERKAGGVEEGSEGKTGGVEEGSEDKLEQDFKRLDLNFLSKAEIRKQTKTTQSELRRS